MDLTEALSLRDQRPRPAAEILIGTVVTVPASGMTVGVDLGGEPTELVDEAIAHPTVQRVRSYTPVVGDVVIVARSGGSLYCLGALSQAPEPEPEPNPEPRPRPKPPPPAPVTKRRSFGPAFTGTYRGSGWRGDTSDLYQADWTGRGANYGAAFYGSGPSSLRGTAVSARVHIMRLAGAGVAAPRPPRMRLLVGKKPSGVPNELMSAWGPSLGFGQSAVWTLPAGWAAALMSGQAGGIGCGFGGEYLALAGPARWSAAMVLEMTWRQ